MLIRVQSVLPLDANSAQRKDTDFRELSVGLTGKFTGIEVRDTELTLRNSYHNVDPTTVTRFLRQQDLQIDVFGSEAAYRDFKQIRVSQFPYHNARPDQLKRDEYFAKVQIAYYVGDGDYAFGDNTLKESFEIPIISEYSVLHFDASEKLWTEPRPIPITEYPATAPVKVEKAKAADLRVYFHDFADSDGESASA